MTMARTIPGQSITQRLMTRVSTRPHVGARASFFARLGVPDPLAIDEGVYADSKKEMFSFLSSASYYQDLRASRFGFLRRLGPDNLRRVAGERIHAVGPRAAMMRPSLLASFSTSGVLDSFLDPSLPVQPDQEHAVAAPVRWAEGTPGPDGGSGQRPMRAPRPVERAMRQEGEVVYASPVVRAMTDLSHGLVGRAQREVRVIVERVQRLPESVQISAARREIRQLRGLASASAHAVVEDIADASNQSALGVAQARLPEPGRTQKGLRRILGQSPAILTIEAPSVEPAAEVDPVAVARRRVRGPESGRVPTASARRQVPVPAVRERARTQQASGRAGPRIVGSSPRAAAPAQQTRRPTEWMASLAVAADRSAATSDVSYGMAAAGAKPVVQRGTARVSMRAHAGEIEQSSGISTGASGWLRDAIDASPRRRVRTALQSPMEVLASPVVDDDLSPEPTRAAVQVRERPSTAAARPARRRVRAARVTETPTVRAIRRAHRRPVASLSASPVRATRPQAVSTVGESLGGSPRTAPRVAGAVPNAGLRSRPLVRDPGSVPVSKVVSRSSDIEEPVAPRERRAAPVTRRRLLDTERVSRLVRSETGGDVEDLASPMSAQEGHAGPGATAPWRRRADTTSLRRRQTPTLRASARAAVSRRSLAASPIQTALLAAQHGEVVPTDAVTGRPLRSAPFPARPVRRATVSATDDGAAPAPGGAFTRESLVDAPVAHRSRRARPRGSVVERVSDTRGPSSAAGSLRQEADGPDLHRAMETIQRRGETSVTAEASPDSPRVSAQRATRVRGPLQEFALPERLGPVEETPVSASMRPAAPVQASRDTAARGTPRVRALRTAEQRPRRLQNAAPPAGLAVRAAARGEAIVRRSASGNMLSPAVLAHVTNEPEAVEAAVVGRRPRPIPITRHPEVALDNRYPARDDIAIRPVQAATERAARRSEGSPAVFAPQTRRGVLAPVPTAYIAPQPEGVAAQSTEIENIGRRDRPTVRAVARAAETTRLNDEGQAVLSQNPTAYVGVARDTRQESLVSSPLLRPLRSYARRTLGPGAALPRVLGTVAPRVLASPDPSLLATEGPKSAEQASSQSAQATRRVSATARIRRLSQQLAMAPPVTDSRRHWVRSPGRATRAVPTLQQHRPAIAAAPMARAAARRLPQARAHRRSTLPRAVNRSDLQYLSESRQPSLSPRPVPSAVSGPYAAPTSAVAPPASSREAQPRRTARRQPVGVGEPTLLAAPPDESAPTSAPFTRERLKSVLKAVAPVVQASGRTGRSVVTVDAARRAVGDARGRRVNVHARLVETPEGRIVRGQATRVSAPGRRRPLAAPQTVVLGAADFDHTATPQSSPVEWSERRVGRSVSAGNDRAISQTRAIRALSRIPANRAIERVEGPQRFARMRQQRPVARTARAASGHFAPPVVAAPDGQSSNQGAVAPRSAQARTGRPMARARVTQTRVRPLERTWNYLGEPSHSGAPNQPAGTRGQPHGVRSSAMSYPVGPEVFGGSDPSPELPQAPGWARRAVEGTPVALAPESRPTSRSRKGGSLLTALARAANPEDVVQVILERAGAGTGGDLPGPAAQLVRRIAKTASASEDAQAVAERPNRRAERGGTVPLRGVSSVRRQVLRSRSVSSSRRSSSRTPAQVTQGLGANNVMKLADKLMQLIHLAESNRRSEAQAQVRMAEDTGQARAEGGLGGSKPQSTESESVNIQTLQQEVLESVLSAIELLQERREGDPDGRHEWW